jgi:hypothetical protein
MNAPPIPPTEPTKPSSAAARGCQLGCMALVSAFLTVFIAVVIGTMVLLVHPPPARFPTIPSALLYTWHGYGFGIDSTMDGVPVGIGPQPWNIPGTIIGLILGITTFWFLVRATRD